MFCAASETKGEVGAVNILSPPPPSNSLLAVPRQLFCCSSLLPVFGARVLVTFHLMCVHIIFRSVWVDEWPPFWTELLTRLAMCSLCILTICIFSYFSFWF